MNLREWALPAYTVLVQMAIGTLLWLWILRLAGRKEYGDHTLNQIIRDPLLILLVTTMVGMVGAHFHLSKPYLSFLALGNLRYSWLSREILFTLVFFMTTGILCYRQWTGKGSWKGNSFLGWLAIGFGMLTVYSMSMIYLIPTQEAWNTPETVLSYFCSMLLLGVMALAAILIMDLRFVEVWRKEKLETWARFAHWGVKKLAFAAAGLLIPVVLMNWYHLNFLRMGTTLMRTSYELLMALYKPLLVARFVVLFFGVGILGTTIAWMKYRQKTIQQAFSLVYWACLLVIVGEVLGRFLFYAAHIRTGL